MIKKHEVFMNKVYYLTSGDYFLSKDVLEVSFIKYIFFDTGKEAVVAKLSQPIRYIDGQEKLSNFTILTSRYPGIELNNLTKFPVTVYLTFLKSNLNLKYEDLEIINSKSLINWAIVELYNDYAEAEKGNIYNCK